MELSEALRSLLGEQAPVGTEPDNDTLFAAGRETWARRERNTLDGAAVIDEMRRRGLSYRQIELATGIPKSTAQRWATPPGEGERE